jgi:hypothetical protein
MLEIDVLSRNKNIFNPNNQDQKRNYGIWDLTRSSISYVNVDVRFKKYFVVKEDEQMRPDLMAYRMYGSMSNTGSLLKLNGVSNPFAIDVGEVFAAPTTKSLDSMFSTRASLLQSDEANNNPNSEFRKSQEQRRFKVSDSRKDFLERRSRAKNSTQQILPPNLLQDGERQTVRTDLVIGLGPDASNGVQGGQGGQGGVQRTNSVIGLSSDTLQNPNANT